MNTSKIEWTDRTWNPVSGCSHVSEGCRNCYAEKLFPRPYPGRKFTDVQCHPDRLDQPRKIKKPQRIFVNSMSDLFHEDVPFKFIDQVFAVMGLSPTHTFQILTKRPERMLKYLTCAREQVLFRCPKSGTTQWHIWSATGGLKGGVTLSWSWKNGLRQEIEGLWPLPNVWLGVSVEDQKTANERIPILLETPAAVRWISAEPLLGPIDLDGLDCWPRFDYRQTYEFHRLVSGNSDPSPVKVRDGLDWVVVGGESGPKARPMDPVWCHSLFEQCEMANVPFFMKQGSQANWPDFKNIESFPSRLQVREFPR